MTTHAVAQVAGVVHALRVIDMGAKAPKTDNLQRVFPHGRGVDTVNHGLEINGFLLLVIGGRG